MVPRSREPTPWILAGILVLVGCRPDTTRPRDVAPAPKAIPKATPYPPRYTQASADSTSRQPQPSDSAKSAMPSIRLTWPDTTTRKPSAPK
jgi:hypothetical protein